MNSLAKARAAGANAETVACPWCATAVGAAIPPGEDEPVFAVHPLPGERQCCPASGLTADEVETPPTTGARR